MPAALVIIIIAILLPPIIPLFVFGLPLWALLRSPKGGGTDIPLVRFFVSLLLPAFIWLSYYVATSMTYGSSSSPPSIEDAIWVFILTLALIYGAFYLTLRAQNILLNKQAARVTVLYMGGVMAVISGLTALLLSVV